MPVELNTLITAVVRAVLDQLDTRPASVAQVLAPKDEALARQVEKRLGSAMQVCFQGQSAGQEPALYILPELSCPDMADLALGRGSSLAQREVLDLLLQGKQVRTLGFAYRAHAATAPDALLRLYEEYEARLAAFGLTELTEAAHARLSYNRKPCGRGRRNGRAHPACSPRGRCNTAGAGCGSGTQHDHSERSVGVAC